MAGSIFGVLSQTLQIYSTLLLIRVLLTWFPGIDWSNGILSALTSITDPYLNIFRGIIPPIGGFDISSILAFLLLNFLQGRLYGLSIYF
ncbi:YggT family protein [Prochlorococcus sp. AH-716-G10]|nr:YggT family protein [Prochlorococcus sp. AH-716-G10]